MSGSSFLQRRGAGVWGERAQEAATRPESTLLPYLRPERPVVEPVKPDPKTGLKPLMLVQRAEARAKSDAWPESVPMQRIVRQQPRPRTPQPASSAWVPQSTLPPPAPVRLPSPVPLLQHQPFAPGDVLFDVEAEQEAAAVYGGCALSQPTPVRPAPQRSQYRVQSPRERMMSPPPRSTAPLNINKKRPLPVPPGPPPDLPLPPVPTRAATQPPAHIVPPPRGSSLKRTQTAPDSVPDRHAEVLAQMRAAGHPLPDLIRAAERNHPLAVWPGPYQLRSQSQGHLPRR